MSQIRHSLDGAIEAQDLSREKAHAYLTGTTIPKPPKRPQNRESSYLRAYKAPSRPESLHAFGREPF